MRATLPIDAVLVHELEKRFVHERRRLQRVTGIFTREVAPRDAMQLAVDERGQLLEGARVSTLPSVEQVGDVPVLGRRVGHVA